VLPDLDFFVIETYPQLLGLVLAISAAALAARVTIKALRRARALEMRAMARPAPSKSVQMPQPSRHTEMGQREFDRVAAYIDDASARAGSVSDTQSKAAQKLDTVEVAVNRLLTDMEGIMTVPRPQEGKLAGQKTGHLTGYMTGAALAR
jgi:hypothetical protein